MFPAYSQVAVVAGYFKGLIKKKDPDLNLNISTPQARRLRTLKGSDGLHRCSGQTFSLKFQIKAFNVWLLFFQFVVSAAGLIQHLVSDSSEA